MKQTDIKELTGINNDVVNLALKDSEKRLKDLIEISKAYNETAQKLLVLLSGASFAALGAGEAIGNEALRTGMTVAGFFLWVPMILLVVLLWGGTYGVLGSSPKQWLREDVLTCPANEFAQLKAVRRRQRAERWREFAGLDPAEQEAGGTADN